MFPIVCVKFYIFELTDGYRNKKRLETVALSRPVVCRVSVCEKSAPDIYCYYTISWKKEENKLFNSPSQFKPLL